MTRIVADYIEVNDQNLSFWVSEYVNNYKPNLIKLGAYYDGKNEVIKKNTVKGRPNYSINANLAKYITDVQTCYFCGQSITYDYTDDEKGKKLKEILEPIFTNNYEDEENFKLASDASCYGAAYEIVMVDPDVEVSAGMSNRLKFAKLDSENTFMVVDNTPLQNPVCAVYMFEKQVTPNAKPSEWWGYVYTKDEIKKFKWSGAAATIVETQDHQFNDIPVIEFANSADQKGDYELITDLLDALSLAISNNTDDLQSIANAILAIYGAGGTDKETIDTINKTKVAKLSNGSKMEYVVKNLNVDSIKHHIDTILKMIYQVSQTPDLSSDDFGGNQSGVAMEFKLWGLEQSRAQKVRNFQKALIKRINLILGMMNLSNGTDFDLLQAINIVFYKNLPKSDSNIYDMVSKLSGIVSDKTLLGQIPFIKDAENELKQKQDEEKEKAAAFVEYNDMGGDTNADNKE